METHIPKFIKYNQRYILLKLLFTFMIFSLTANGQDYVNIVHQSNNYLSSFDDGGIPTNYNTNWDAAFDGFISTQGNLDYAVHTYDTNLKEITFNFNEPFYDLTFEYYNRSNACCDQRIDGSKVTFWADPEDGSGNLIPYERSLYHTNEDYNHVIRVSPHTNAYNVNNTIADIHNTKFVKVTLQFIGDVQNFREIQIIGTREGGTHNVLPSSCNLAQTATFDDGGIFLTDFARGWSTAFDGVTTSLGSNNYTVDTQNAANKTITFTLDQAYNDVSFRYYNRIDPVYRTSINGSKVTFHYQTPDGQQTGSTYRYLTGSYDVIEVAPDSNTGNTDNLPINTPSIRVTKVTLEFSDNNAQHFREIMICGTPAPDLDPEPQTCNNVAPIANLFYDETIMEDYVNTTGWPWDNIADGDTGTNVQHDYAVHLSQTDGKTIGFDLDNIYSNVSLKFYNRHNGNSSVQQRINGSYVTFYAHDNADEGSRTYKSYSRYLNNSDEYGVSVIQVSPYTTIGTNTNLIIENDELGQPLDFETQITQNSITPHDNFYKVTITFNGDVQNFREVEICGILSVSNQDDTCWQDNNGNGIIYNGTAEVNTLKTNYLLAGAYPDIIENTVAHFDGRLYISEKDITPDTDNERGLNDTSNINYQNHLLWVEEGIVTNDIALADVSDWPDYVFNEDYNLNSLKQLKAYINKYGHLPTIPSALELANIGRYSQVDMSKRTVKTIEEVMLHILRQEDEINELQKALKLINESFTDDVYSTKFNTKTNTKIADVIVPQNLNKNKIFVDKESVTQISELNPNLISGHNYRAEIQNKNVNYYRPRFVDLGGADGSVDNDGSCWQDNGNSISYPGTATAQTFKTNYLAVGANANIIDNTIAHFDGRVYISEKDDAPNPNNEQGLNDTTSENYQDYLLWVEEGIVTNDVAFADVTDWPDYVFDEDYKLNTLLELKAFIDRNGHLPTMPSAKIVEQNGFSQVDMTKRTIKTIEELTLYTIKQKQRITAIEKEIDAKMEYLQALLEKRKKL